MSGGKAKAMANSVGVRDLQTPASVDMGSEDTAGSVQSLHSRSATHRGKSYGTQGPPPPNSTLVLKNLDYGMSAMDLENLLREVLGSRKAYTNLTMVDDKARGSFRGVAFVNFHTLEEAKDAFPLLAALKVNNRKMFVEYRRVKAGEKLRFEKRSKGYDPAYNKRATFEMDVSRETDENGNEIDKRTTFFAKRDTARRTEDRQRTNDKSDREKEKESDFRNQLIAYRDAEVPEGEEIQDVCFDHDLSSYERRIVHVLCDELGLGHVSRSMEDGSRVLFVTKDPQRQALWEIETADARAVAAEKAAEKAASKAANKAAAAEEKRKRLESEKSQAHCGRSSPEPRCSSPVEVSGSSVNKAPSKEELDSIKWFRPRSAALADPSDSNGRAGVAARNIEKPSYKMYIPPRQPNGPDGTRGFLRRNPAPLVDSSEILEAGGSMEISDCHVAVANLNAGATSGSGTCGDEAGKTAKPARAGKPRIVLNPNVPEFIFPSI